MPDVERLVLRAEQLEKLAADTVAPDHKRQLLQIAASWREVAARAARAEERTIPRPARRERDADEPAD